MWKKNFNLVLELVTRDFSGKLYFRVINLKNVEKLNFWVTNSKI